MVLIFAKDGANGDHKFSPNWIRRGGAGDPLSRDGSRIVFADLRGTGIARCVPITSVSTLGADHEHRPE